MPHAQRNAAVRAKIAPNVDTFRRAVHDQFEVKQYRREWTL
jgi:hypothetical protein